METKIKCEKCGKEFKTQNGLKMHLISCGNNNEIKSNVKKEVTIQKTEREIKIEEARKLVQILSGQRIICIEDVKSVYALASFFAPNVDFGSHTCSACVTHAFNVLRANI